MNRIKRLACRVGVHKWVTHHNPENSAPYLKCDRCRKEKDTISVTGFGF